MDRQGSLQAARGVWAWNPDLASLLLALLEIERPSKVLVVESGRTFAEAVTAAGHEALHVRAGQDLLAALAAIHQVAPCAAALVVPTFGSGPTPVGSPHGWDLPKGYPEDYLLANTVEALAQGAPLVALVSYGLLTGFTRRSTRQGLIARGLSAVVSVPSDLLFRDGPQIPIGLILLRHSATALDRLVLSNYVNLAEMPNADQLLKEIDPEATAAAGAGERNLVAPTDLAEDLRLDPPYYDPGYLKIRPPGGYQDYALVEIADIRGGLGIYGRKDRFEDDPGGGTPYCQVRHILQNGEISPDHLWIKKKPANADETGWAKPGDILVTVAGTIGKVAPVSARYREGVYFDTSIRRIRVDKQLADVDTVLGFLRSDLGQLQFRRLTSGTVIPQLTSPSLSSLRVFIPPKTKSIPSGVSPATSTSAQAIVIANALEEQVVLPLKSVTEGDTDWQGRTWASLRGFLEKMLPAPIDELAKWEFPAPIAVPYVRFMAARFNSYERLDRFVSLVESCVHFVFHVVVSDYCRQGWRAKGQLSKTSSGLLARLDDSAEHRLRFVEDAIETASKLGIDLFMPEIRDTSLLRVGDTVRKEVRNPTAHSAPTAEPRVQRLIETHLPSVLALLEEMRFLSEYRLCQVQSLSFHKGRWWCQANFHRGSSHEVVIDEFPLAASDDEPHLIEAERDHIVLLSPSYDVLDLHPFYQVYAGEETGHEAHLCFLKRSTSSARELRGESVRSGGELNIPGFEDLRSLVGGGEPD